MAEPDPLLDEDLNDADRRTVDAIESPLPQSGTGPEPGDLGDIAPEAPVAPPAEAESTAPALAPGAAAPLPGAVEPLPGMSSPIVPGSAEDISRQQGNLDVQKAGDVAKIAKEQADTAAEADEDARLERADYLQRRQDAEKDLDAKTKRYEATKLVDPRSRSLVKSKIAIAFGGLGAAYRSAGGGDANNHVLANLQKQWEDDTELQKANIAALRDNAVMARTKLDDIDEGRRRMARDADARLLAKYNLALKQGEAQLKNRGVPQAEIDADKRILQLREARRVAELKAREAEDKHALDKARATALERKLEHKGGGGVSPKEQRARDKAQRDEDKPDLDETKKVVKDLRAKAVGTNKSPGPVGQLSRIQAMRSGLQKAIEEGNQDAMATEITSVIEEGGSMMSGGKTTNTQADLLKSLQTKPEKMKAQLDNLLGKKQVSEAYARRFVELLNGLEQEKHKEADDLRGGSMNELLAPGGIAANDAAKKRALAGVDGVFSQVKNADGTPRYETRNDAGRTGTKVPTEQAPPRTHQGTNAGPQPGTVLRLKDGRTVRTRADGGYDLVSSGRR